MNKHKYKIGLVVLSLIVIALVFILRERAAGPQTNDQSLVIDSTAQTTNIFMELPLEAKAVYVYDVKNDNMLFGAFENTQLPLASLTKMMTVITALSHVSAPNDTRVGITEGALAQEGDSGLYEGEIWNLEDLAGFTLITSSNDGAQALALGTSLWVGQPFNDLMNALAGELGLAQTYFLNATGLDITEGSSGAYGSARDVAEILAYGIKYFSTVFSQTIYAEKEFISKSGFSHRAENTNEEVFKDVGIIASKTGFTDLAGGNLAVAFDVGPARPVIIVVLGSTQEGRFSDVRTLMEATTKTINQ